MCVVGGKWRPRQRDKRLYLGSMVCNLWRPPDATLRFLFFFNFVQGFMGLSRCAGADARVQAWWGDGRRVMGVFSTVPLKSHSELIVRLLFRARA